MHHNCGILKNMGVVEKRQFKKAKCLNSTMEISTYIAIGLKIITVASGF